MPDKDASTVPSPSPAAPPSAAAPAGPTPFQSMGASDQAAFLHSILQASTEYSIIAKALDGTILAWNEGARRLYGYEPVDVVGKANAFLLHDPADVTSGRAARILDEARRTGAWSGEIARVRKDGSRFTANVTITLRRDPAGGPIGFTMISRDLTESQRLLLQLRESQEYNRGLIESNIDALMTTDPLGLITDVNRQMCALTGFAREDLVGSPFKRYFTDAKRAEDGIRKVLSEERVTNYELTTRARDERETVVSYNATTFRSADGRLRGVFAAARDITEQKRLEVDLRQAQNYTRSLIEASVDALVTVDPGFLVTDVNEQTVRMTGCTRLDLIGSSFLDYFTDPERARAGVQRTLAEGFVTDYVLVLRSKTGAETLVSFNASVFKDTEGRPLGIFAAARDITEQKRLEEELRQAQNYTRGLIESSVDPMITVDRDLMITDVNEQMVRLTETPKDKLIGSRFDRWFTQPDLAASGVRKTLSDGFVTNYELTLRTAGGRSVLVSFNASIFRDTEGNIRGIFAVARDVTDQRRLEAQLREQQNYSRGLIEASVDALVTVDPGGRITDVNEQLVKLTGHGRSKLVGSPFADYFTDPDRATAGVRKTLQEGLVKNYELVVRTKAGTELAVSFNAAVFRDTAGAVAGIFAAARDITDQKGLERELRDQQAYNRGLIESNIDALMTTDPLGVITDVNRQMCLVTGRAREALIGTPFKDYFTDPSRAEAGIRQVLGQGKVTNYELTIRGKDGRETVVSYNATTFTGEDGRLRGVFAAARDITDQKRLEDQLRQAQNYNRGLIESSVDAMLTVAPDLTITDVNEQMVKLTGYERDQLVGSAFQDYFTEPDRAGAGVRKTLSEGFVTNYELTLRSRHRREILVSFNASVFKDIAGNVRGIFAVARDVTEQRRLEEQLREQQNYNRGLIESSVDALVTVDPDLIVTDVNEQMVRLTGYGREELVGSPFKEYFTEPDRAARGVREALAKGSVTNYELVLKSRTGKRTIVSFNAGTFKDTAGRVAGILAAARDITAQKRLEEQLRDQQNYNRSLIESSVDALLTVDPNRIITDVNEQTVKLTGYNRKQLIGSPFVDYFTEPERARSGVEQTFREGFVTNYELVSRSKSGRKIPVSFNAAVFRDAAGTVGGILAAARDVTQAKQIEQELREQQTYTRGLIESNIDALMTTDTIGIITDVNRQMCAVTGRTREELIGTAFKEFFTDPRRAEDGIRRVLSEDRVTNYELTLRSKDGRETVVSYNATTFRGADGRLRGVFAAARDITDQKRLEEQIRRQNRDLTEATAFLNNVLESSTEYSIIAIDLGGTVLAWNEGARRNYGYPPEEMVGKQRAEVLHTPEDLASGRVRAFFDAALQGGKGEGVFERVRKDGRRFTASVAISLRRDATGTPIGYVVISKDITDQKRLEEQLRRKNVELEEQNRRVQEANRLKSEFLANMSHELRTPLNGVIGFADVLHKKKAGAINAEQEEYLGDILTSSRHLLQLINDVLDLAKVESGKMEFRPERIDLARTVAEVRDIVRTMAAKKRLAIAVQVGAEVGAVHLDPGKFKQVLYNYLSNAIKFTPDEGRISIRIRGEGADRFRIEVEDTGIGIRAEDMGRLFVEFQQLDASAAKKYQGTGLGLALTKRIVEAQGGTVGVSSTPGKGSVFFCSLPRTTVPAALVGVAGGVASVAVAAARRADAVEEKVAAAPAAGPGPGTDGAEGAEGGSPGRARILVVEDDAGDRAWLTRTLTQAGFAVEAVATGAEAVERCRARRFAAVTLDLILPDTVGWEVLRALREGELNRETPVIVATVVAQSGAAAGFRIHDFLVKPLRPNDLLASLRRAGVVPGEARPVLVVDDEPDSLKLISLHLGEAGLRAVCRPDGPSGLLAVEAERPAAIILDLMMPGMDGFEFLDRLRVTAIGARMPVLVWTAKDLTAADFAHLRATSQAVVLKQGGGVDRLLEELRRCLAGAPGTVGAGGAGGAGGDPRGEPNGGGRGDGGR
ncbi:MAG: PAS domain S-box protein [Planctomycetes bacterium]|nr:PAS domain S-box protein [Planctomycetota bacterium]